MVLWQPKHGKRFVTFVDLLKADTGVSRDCLPATMVDRTGWRKRAKGSTEVDLVVVVVVVVVGGRRREEEEEEEEEEVDISI